MAITRLTIPEIRAIYEQELISQFSMTTAVPAVSILSILAKVWAGVDNAIYGFIEDKAKQVIIDTAEIEFLERWAAIWGLSRKAAVFAKGSVKFTGTNGTNIPIGTEIINENGITYKTDIAIVISVGIAVVAVTASTAGITGNMLASDTLTLVSAISGVDSTATVESGGLTNGTNQETDLELRTRLLAKIRSTAQGGTVTDFENKVLEESGVTRVFVFENQNGAGTVGVSFVLDNNTPITPDAAKIATVQATLELFRPITSSITVFAPVLKNLDMTVNLSPNTTAVQATVTAELTDMLKRDATPGGTILLSKINEAISIASGEVNHVLVTPIADVVHASGELAVLGTITFGTL